MVNRHIPLLIGVLGLVACAPLLLGLINPNFTPLHLVEQSGLIARIEISHPITGNTIRATIVEVLKGKPTGKTVVIDLSKSAFEAHAKAVKGMLETMKGTPVLLFVGAFHEETGDAEADMEEAGEEEVQKGFLHANGKWITLFSGKGKNTWEMEKLDSHMQGTWAGGTDMLARAVRYILKDPDADVPVKTFAEWAGKKKVTTIPGKVYGMRALAPFPDGKTRLFVAAEKGDRLFLYNEKKGNLEDVTSAAKISSASRLFVWGDFTRDGLLDLVSWDGKKFVLLVQGKGNTFARKDVPQPDPGVKECLTLCLLDRKGIPCVLIGTPKGALTWNPANGKTVSLPRPKETLLKKAGKGGRCVAGDFDGDAVPDVLQLFDRGGLFYRGEGEGGFAAPRVVRISLGKGVSTAFTGDYDADGLLDVFTTGEDAERLWHNLGKANFVETLYLAGEIAYISKPGAVDGMTGDVNNDGRQDIFLAYSGMAPQIFFNRGFRSFGHSHMLDLAEKGLLPEAEEGQYAGCLGDLNDDGAQDMAIALKKDNTLWIFLRDPGMAFPLALRVRLSPKARFSGPLTVVGYRGTRCLGAWNVSADGGEAFFGHFEAGPCTVTWKFPGAKQEKKEVILEDKPVVLTLK